MIYMFLSNNPSSGDINSSNLSCLIWETLSFNLMYVAACYPVGTTISKTSSLFTALLQHFKNASESITIQ